MSFEIADHVPGLSDEQLRAIADEAEAGYELAGRQAEPRQPHRTSRRLDRLVADLRIETVPMDAEQVRVARAAYRDFGCGSGHPAKLNLGDCFAYALASVTGEPLLFKGGDYGHTDVRAG